MGYGRRKEKLGILGELRLERQRMTLLKDGQRFPEKIDLLSLRERG